MVGVSASSFTPTPLVAFPCGSQSTSRVASPATPSAAERLIAVVVLPTPPLRLAMQMILPTAGSPTICSPRRKAPLEAENKGRVRELEAWEKIPAYKLQPSFL